MLKSDIVEGKWLDEFYYRRIVAIQYLKEEKMNPVRKTYVEFFELGSIFYVHSTKEVKDRDIAKIDFPENAYAFRFFDLLSAIVESEGKIVKLSSGRINESPLFYYGGQVYTYEEVAKKFPNEQVLLERMKIRGWDEVIMTRNGEFQPFLSGIDILIKPA